MFFTPDNYISDIRKSMRGGDGEVIIDHITKDSLPQNSRMLARITLNKGCSIGYHVHENETEVFYFVSGNGTVDDNGTVISVKAGDCVITSNGFGHSVRNDNDEPLVIFATIILI